MVGVVTAIADRVGVEAGAAVMGWPLAATADIETVPAAEAPIVGVTAGVADI